MHFRQGELIQKLNKPELSSLYMIHCLNMIKPSVKFLEYVPCDSGVMSRARRKHYIAVILGKGN